MTTSLTIWESRKGTRVVLATELYEALELPKDKYAATLKKWLKDVYVFRDGVRRPEAMRDYARRSEKQHTLLEDYYISVELAKLATTHSSSKFKAKYSRYLEQQENLSPASATFTIEQVQTLVTMSKAMGLVSCQEACESHHRETYLRQQGQPQHWTSHRNEILGYSNEDLKEQNTLLGKTTTGKTRRELLVQTDKYELVRSGVIDLFMAMGKQPQYACQAGNLAKTLAHEIDVEIVDDRNGATLFAPKVDPSIVEELKALQPGNMLRVWS